MRGLDVQCLHGLIVGLGVSLIGIDADEDHESVDRHVALL